jgi:hypothetical protein
LRKEPGNDEKLDGMDDGIPSRDGCSEHFKEFLEYNMIGKERSNYMP